MHEKFQKKQLFHIFIRNNCLLRLDSQSILTNIIFLESMKGLKVQGKTGSYTLKNAIGTGGFATVYTTQHEDIICKVQNLSNSPSDAYKKEKYKPSKTQTHFISCAAPKYRKIIRSHLTHSPINQIRFAVSGELQQGVGIVVIKCSNMFKLIESTTGDIPEHIVVNVFYSVACALEAMHQNGLAHRDIKLENVMITKTGQYKLIDFGSASDQVPFCVTQVIKLVSKDNREDIAEDIDKNTTPLYRAPQQLDLHSNYQIGPKVDIFALGCMVFMMCFKKQPFEMRLSAINGQYFMPEESIYSEQLKDAIRKCFVLNPVERPSASAVARLLKPLVNSGGSKRRAVPTKIGINTDAQFKRIIVQFPKNKPPSQNNTQIVKPSVMGKIKRMFSQMTTQTQSWIANFIEQSEQSPPLKYNRNIISKCWQKRYKVDKVYSIILAQTEININKSLVILKVLILLHNFLKKGPHQAITGYSDEDKIKQNKAVKTLLLIFKNWRRMNPNDKSDDLKRNQLICHVILLYDLILLDKIKLCEMHSCFIEGNYCPLPYLQGETNQKILSVRFLEDLMILLAKIIALHQKVWLLTIIPEIQRSIVLSLVDEEYCLVSFLVHLYSAFKQSTNFLPTNQDIDEEAVRLKILELDTKIIELYSKLLKMFEVDSKKYSQQMGGKFIKLNFEVIGYIKGIKILNPGRQTVAFQIHKYLSFDKNLYGLIIPDTYEGVTKKSVLEGSQKNIEPKSSENIVELEMFKKKVVDQARNGINVNVPSDTTDVQKPREIKPKPPTKKPIQPTQVKSIASKPAQSSIKPVSAHPLPTTQIEHKINDNKQHSEVKQQPVTFDNFMIEAGIMEFSHQNLNVDFRKSKIQQKPVPQTIIQHFQQTQKNLENQGVNVVKFDDDESPKVQQFQEKPVLSKKAQQVNLIRFDDDEPIQIVSTLEKKNASPLKQIDLVNVKESASSLPESTTSQTSRASKRRNQIFLKKSPEEVEINLNEIEFGNILEKNELAEVFQGKWKGQDVAVKKINLENNRIENAKSSLLVFIQIRPHPHLVTTLGFAERKNMNSLFIVNQFCKGGNLYQLLHIAKTPVNWQNKVNLAKQIAKGMLSLHINKPPIFHKNLNSHNIFLIEPYNSQSDKIRVKIGGFGGDLLERSLSQSSYIAPQFFLNEPVSPKTDIYSYGILVWETITRRLPYKQFTTIEQIMNSVVKGERPEIEAISQKCPQQLKEIVIRCWDLNPSLRPDFKQILKVLGTITFMQ